MEMPAGKELREASNQQMEGTEALNPTACNHVSLDVDRSYQQPYRLGTTMISREETGSER